MRFLLAAVAWLVTLAVGSMALVYWMRADMPFAVMLPLAFLVGTLPIVTASCVFVTTTKRP